MTSLPVDPLPRCCSDVAYINMAKYFIFGGEESESYLLKIEESESDLLKIEESDFFLSNSAALSGTITNVPFFHYRYPSIYLCF